MMDSLHYEPAVLTVSDYSQLGSLQEYLSWATSDVLVSRIPGSPSAGDQGALDVLAVLASSSGLIAAIKVLPEFLRSRKTGLSITMKINDEAFTLTATNVDEVMPILNKLLDG
jgi:hypothetical protein